MMTVKPKRRDRNYLAKVEAELMAIYRQARIFSEDDAEITPTDMLEIKKSSKRALETLGWEVPD